MYKLVENTDLKKSIHDYLTRNYTDIDRVLKDKKLNRYNLFTIHCSSKERVIESPTAELKKIQKALLEICKKHIEFSSEVQGYVKSRNILTNATIHLGALVVLNIDIKKFFHTITSKQIRKVLTNEPLSFNKSDVKLIIEIATIKSENNTAKRILPLGSPLSSLLSNIICHELDVNLLQIAKQNNLRYSRYADDITFSTDDKFINKATLSDIRTIINKNDFTVNDDKTKMKRKPGTLEVTGLIVNDKVNVKRKYLKLVRAILHNWKKSGIDEVMNKYYSTNRYKRKTNIKCNHEAFIRSIRGKIEFIGMIKGKEDNHYRNNLIRFEELINNT